MSYDLRPISGARLSDANFVQHGYGQVEPNHLSAQRTGQIYAQLPADKSINKLENGQFVKYNYVNGRVDFEGAGEWMLVFNEVKVYGDRETDADFAMLRPNYAGRIYDAVGNKFVPTDVANGSTASASSQSTDPTKEIGDVHKMVPRVLKTNIGDIYTTNAIKAATTTTNGVTTVVTPALGTLFTPDTDGFLKIYTPSSAEGAVAPNMQWQVVKVYTMPDGQPGVKLMRIV